MFDIVFKTGILSHLAHQHVDVFRKLDQVGIEVIHLFADIVGDVIDDKDTDSDG